MQFEWDATKNQSNIAKHGVSFKTAVKIFDGPVLTGEDKRFDYGESREISIGAVQDIVILTVVHTDRNGNTRIISARPASKSERKRYDEEIQKRTEP